MHALLRLAFFISGFCLSACSFAVPGDLRKHFGTNGVVLTPPLQSELDDEMLSIAAHPTGAIFASGVCLGNVMSGSPNSRFCVRRYLSTGAIDTSFGSAGTLLPFSEIGFSASGASAVAVDDSGRILVSGWCSVSQRGQNFCSVRLLSNGSLDTSFGNGGRFLLAVHELLGVDLSRGYSVVEAMRALPGGRFLLAGTCSRSNTDLRPTVCATRHLSNGALDTSYATGGVFTSTFRNEGTDTVKDMVLKADGGVILVGNNDNAAYAMALASNGSVENAFGTQGIVRLIGAFGAASGNVSANNAALWDSSKLLVSGGCMSAAPTIYRACVLALDPNTGLPSSAFGSQGVTAIEGNTAYVFSAPTVAVRRDGKLLLAGLCGEIANVTTQQFCTILTSPAGVTDANYGVGGIALANEASGGAYMSLANASLFDSQGNALVGGTCYSGRPPYYEKTFCLAQFHTKQDFFDLDNDNETLASTDGVLFLRHLFGFKENAMVSDALGTFARRLNGSEIEGHLNSPNSVYPNCSRSIVGASGGATAFVDGLILLRSLLGLSGDAVTDGLTFPAGSSRTTWPDIKAHLVTNCGALL